MLITALALAAALAGCASPDSHVARIDTDAPSYQQAHASCWQKGEGMPTAAPGSGPTRMHAYAKCIKDEGWDDRWAVL
jgi:hypothetical protein